MKRGLSRRNRGEGGDSASATRNGALPAAPGSTLFGLLLLAALWAPFVVFWVPAHDPFRLPKLLAAETLGLASLVALAATGRLTRGAGSGRARRDRWLAALGLASLGLVAALGFFSTEHPEHLRSALPSLMIGLACALGWAFARPGAELRRAIDALPLPALVLAVVAIAQALDLWQPFQIAERIYESRLRITSLVGNSGDLSMALVLPLLVAQDRLMRTASRDETLRSPRFVGAAATVALLLVALVLSQGLSALAAVAAGSVALWLFGPHRRSAIRGLALVSLIALLGATLHPGIRGRLFDKVLALAAGNVNDFLTFRLDGWRAAVWMTQRHPLTGVGFGSFAAEYADAKLALLDQGITFGQSTLTTHFETAHNDYLQWLAETGALGGVALAAALTLLLSRLIRLPRDELPLAAAGVMALALLAAVQFPFHLAVVGYPALLWIAWILGAPPPGAATTEER